jgi:hypothetical protein
LFSQDREKEVVLLQRNERESVVEVEIGKVESVKKEKRTREGKYNNKEVREFTVFLSGSVSIPGRAGLYTQSAISPGLTPLVFACFVAHLAAKKHTGMY